MINKDNNLRSRVRRGFAGSGLLGDTPRQLLRYGIIGVVLNLFLYLGYLALTGLGVGHKSSMTISYVTGIFLSFTANRMWSFGHRGQVSKAFARFGLACAGGYVLNLALLWWLVDRLGLPHAWVQGALIFVVAGFLFLAQKLWVFPPG